MEDLLKITQRDPRYPTLIRELHDAPKTLWLRGNLDLLKLPAVAIVGTRRASPHGLTVARTFAGAFARAGIAVVSGLAFGIDSAAHAGALEVNGPTIAVLGSGVTDDAIHPRDHLRLAQNLLAKGGLIISETDPALPIQPYMFPRRNRLIAVLAKATIVVEAPIKSGALITAKFALELGRDVYAVPADTTRETARGSNKLLSFGAPPLLDPQELIQTLSETPKFDAGVQRPHNPIEEQILDALKAGPTHVDDLVNATKLPAHTVHATLTSLELRGAIIHLGNMQFSRSLH